MNTLIGRFMAVALVLLACLAVACSFDETEKANELINAGNASVTEGNRLLQEASAKTDKLFDSVSPEQYLAERDSVKELAQDSSDSYEKSAAKYREASAKFDEASKFKINEKLKEYLQLKSQEFARRAEQCGIAKATAQAFMDSSDAQTLQKKVMDNKDRADKLEKEAGELAEKSSKIQEENKSIFKSDSK